MTTWTLVMLLVAPPLGYALGRALTSRPSPRVVHVGGRSPTDLDQARDQYYGKPVESSRGSQVRREAPATRPDLQGERERMAADLARSESERDRLRGQVAELRQQIESANMGGQEVREVERDASRQLDWALKERDRALARLENEKARHALTHDRLAESAEQVGWVGYRTDHLATNRSQSESPNRPLAQSGVPS